MLSMSHDNINANEHNSQAAKLNAFVHGIVHYTHTVSMMCGSRQHSIIAVTLLITLLSSVSSKLMQHRQRVTLVNP